MINPRKHIEAAIRHLELAIQEYRIADKQTKGFDQLSIQEDMRKIAQIIDKRKKEAKSDTQSSG